MGPRFTFIVNAETTRIPSELIHLCVNSVRIFAYHIKIVHLFSLRKLFTPKNVCASFLPLLLSKCHSLFKKKIPFLLDLVGIPGGASGS